MAVELQAQMFDFGPLHQDRHEIVNLLKGIPVQTGDILYRASNAKGPLGLPFSRMVADITKSPYSHAAILTMDETEPYVLEVNDQGTLKYRLIDWLDTCYTKEFAVYRLKDIDAATVAKVGEQINKILEEDPDYDFSFSDSSHKLYCVQSVALIYNNVGIKIWEPEYAQQIAPYWVYCLFKLGNPIFKLFGCHVPLDVKLYYVGNKQRGMMSSDKTYCVFHHLPDPTL